MGVALRLLVTLSGHWRSNRGTGLGGLYPWLATAYRGSEIEPLCPVSARKNRRRVNRPRTFRHLSAPPDLPPRTILLFKVDSVAMGRPDRANARVQPMSEKGHLRTSRAARLNVRYGSKADV